MKTWMISIFVLAGSLFILIAALGLLRFRDLFSRMHASTKATSFGILLILAGAALFFSNGSVWVKSVLVVLFIYLTAPLAAHAVANSYKPGDGEEPEDRVDPHET